METYGIINILDKGELARAFSIFNRRYFWRSFNKSHNEKINITVGLYNL